MSLEEAFKLQGIVHHTEVNCTVCEVTQEPVKKIRWKLWK